MRLSEIIATPLQTSAFAESPLRQHRQVVEQQLHQGPPPSVQVQLSPWLGEASPAQALRADAQRDVTYHLNPLGQLAEPVDAVHTPSYTRGQYRPVEGPDLSVRVELGPILWSHVERGSPAARLLDVQA